MCTKENKQLKDTGNCLHASLTHRIIIRCAEWWQHMNHYALHDISCKQAAQCTDALASHVTYSRQWVWQVTTQWLNAAPKLNTHTFILVTLVNQNATLWIKVLHLKITELHLQNKVKYFCSKIKLLHEIKIIKTYLVSVYDELGYYNVHVHMC